ncbi:MAG: alanine--glyoxylate aminotransferase family protein [Candidatus Omnitrophica bacterium]|nr:alanine--glyoxylate aminotransferase family protein [Candidatus Omnitrophota bacterium]
MRKEYLLTPGPTPLPPEVQAALARPIIHHRTPAYRALFEEVLAGIQYVLQTKATTMMFTSSGTGAMEAAVVNLLSPGDRALVISGGKFGERWTELCEAYGVEPLIVEVPYGQALDVDHLRRRMKKDIKLKRKGGFKAVFATLSETSTGVVHDIQALGALIKDLPAVLVVDAISGLGADELKPDQWGVDVVIAGSQKGLMIPPGLAFASVSPKAWALVERAALPRYYFDFRRYRKALEDQDTPFTPAVSLVVALDEALQLLRKEGLDKVLSRHRMLAMATRTAIKGLGLELFAHRPSNALTAVKVPLGVDGKRLVGYLRDQLGVTIAGGQGEMAGKVFRIAHLGYMAQFDIIIAIAAIEMGLLELKYKVKLGNGVRVAEEILARLPA